MMVYSLILKLRADCVGIPSAQVSVLAATVRGSLTLHLLMYLILTNFPMYLTLQFSHFGKNHKN